MAESVRNKTCTMKVLVISNMFPSPTDPATGVFVAEQVESLRESMEVKVVARRQGTLGGYPEFMHSAFAATRQNPGWLVHAHYGFHSALVALLFAKAPVITTFHGSDALEEPFRNRLYWLLQRHTVLKSTRIIAVSHQIKRKLVSEFGADQKRVDVIPCGVDTRKFRPIPQCEARSILGLSTDMRMVLFLGRLVPEKGLEDIRLVAEELPQHLFYLLGNGTSRWVSPNCRFTGPVPHLDVPYWLNAADLLVLPSYTEGTPVAIMEAMACGTPVVASRVGACEDMIVEGVTGFLTGPGETRSLVAAIEAITDVRGCPSLNPELARQTAVENYDIRHIAGRLRNTYEAASHT